MKKKLFAIVLVCTVILTQWSPVTARVIRDETVPYEGGYILAINGSANFTSKKSTGPLTEEDTIDLYKRQTHTSSFRPIYFFHIAISIICLLYTS